jgi:hypothetical protein
MGRRSIHENVIPMNAAARALGYGRKTPLPIMLDVLCDVDALGVGGRSRQQPISLQNVDSKSSENYLGHLK